MNKISILLFWVTCIVVGFFAVKNLFLTGYFPMHDDTQPTRIFLMKEALLDGQFPVRWVEHLGYGYGYPIFNFYAPLPYYLGAFITFLGFDVIDAAKLLFLIATAGSFVSMFVFLRKLINGYGSLAGAALYTLFPYHAVNTYVRGALSEQFGYLFLPLVFLGYLKLTQNDGKRNKFFWSVLLGICSALIIISHNLSAIIISVSLLPIFLFHIFQSSHKKIFLANLILSFVIALGLSAFYLVPVIFESRFSNVHSQVGGGADFKDHFICVTQFWNGAWGFGGSTPGCDDGMSFKLGKVNIILFAVSILIGIYSVFVGKNKKGTIAFYFGGALVVIGIFFSMSISKHVWEFFPLLEYIQYPWRFLTIVGVGMSIVIGYALSKISEYKKNIYLSIALLFFVILFTLINNAKLFQPQARSEENLEKYTSAESIRYTISKISDEYMPRNFNKPKSIEMVPRDYLVASEFLEILRISGSSKKIEAKINAKADQDILLNLAPFPSWKILLDEKRTTTVETKKGILIPVRAGQHILVAELVPTIAQMLGNILTIVTIFGLGAAIMRKLYGKKTS